MFVVVDEIINRFVVTITQDIGITRAMRINHGEEVVSTPPTARLLFCHAFSDR
ncbi:MAG: hypothetical protein GPOALKHO_000626 [Sodalis sp.]|nr:MAG: hypothetical protein GPOALKHO_000626 [Sodalis sp.]